jgi:hypothetical protein
MEGKVKVLGAFVDTLVLNIYPTDAQFEIEERRIDPFSRVGFDVRGLEKRAEEVG